MAEKIDKETERKIQELQISEQAYQSLLMQKQAFEMELIEKASDHIFKVLGQIMIRADKDEVKKELEEKQKLLALRIKSLEKQESSVKEKVENLRQEILKKIKK
jgi:prefoldin beta subunit